MFGRKKDEQVDWRKEYERQRIEREAAVKEATERAERELEEYKRLDRQAMEDARSYVPLVEVKEYPTGQFLCFEGGEWPIRYIESIETDSVGSAPHLGFGWEAPVACKAGKASISINLHSGRTSTVRCNRFQLDALLDALRTAWKTGERTP